MDRRTLLAIALSALVLIFVPMVLEMAGLTPPRQPAPGDTTGAPAPPPEISRGESTAPPAGTTPAEIVPPAPGDPATDPASSPRPGAFGSAVVAPEREIAVETDLYQARFSSRGARLTGLTLHDFNSPSDHPVRLEGDPTLVLDVGAERQEAWLAEAAYAVSESLDAQGRIRRLRFSAVDTAGARVVQTYSFDPESYEIGLDVEMFGVLDRGHADYRLEMQSWPLITERNRPDDLNALQAVSRVGSDIKRDPAKDLAKKGARRHEGAVQWTAVRSKYFVVAAVPREASAKAAYTEAGTIRASDAATPPEQVAAGLVLPVPPPGRVHRLVIYAGPNDYWRLEKVGSNLEDVVDLGWRWLLPFSRAILKAMVFLHQFIPNYGLVIIVLSVLVKLLFHPLTAASMRSMRSMQKIQPKIEEVRKKYAKDPQKMNEAVMALYKENKVNPLGGCLPLLIQMPVLFALYQVFLHALELRQAPFLLWINDLSTPDQIFEVAGFPIRVLPLIMYGSAWLQQKMTPTDSRQVMTMHLMNLFLLVIFYNLPSGLVLYWTVTNLLTALQQYLVNRGDAPQLAAKAA